MLDPTSKQALTQDFSLEERGLKVIFDNDEQEFLLSNCAIPRVGRAIVSGI